MRLVVVTVVAFVLGGIGGALCDQIHVRSGVLSYPSSFFLGQPWWVAPVFGMGAPIVLFGAWPFVRGAARPARRDLVIGFLWFFGAYAGSGVFDEDAAVPYAVALGLTWVGRVVLAPASERVAWVVFSLLLAAAGCAWEGYLSSTGAFGYARPLYWVPVWLPGIYMHGAPLALAVARAVMPPSGTRAASP